MAGTELRYTYISKGTYWRFRHKLTGDVPLPHKRGVLTALQPQEPEFIARYAELIDIIDRRRNKRPAARSSFAWLIDRYLHSAEFAALADATQRDYAKTCELLVAELGEVRYAQASRNILKTVRDDFAATPRKAHKIKQMLSRLYSWADGEDLVPAGLNPAAAIKRIRAKSGDREITVWSDSEIDLFFAHAPAHVRTIAMIALYTGQRRRDVWLMTWQQYQGDIVRVRQSKTRRMLDIACHSRLRRHLDGVKPGASAQDDRICLNAAGGALTINAMSKAVSDAVAKVPGFPRGRSLHGLRYAAGSMLEEAGCSVAEIESVLGHETYKMAMKYASQRVRAKAAIGKIETAEGAAGLAAAIVKGEAK